MMEKKYINSKKLIKSLRYIKKKIKSNSVFDNDSINLPYDLMSDVLLYLQSVKYQLPPCAFVISPNYVKMSF